MPFERGTLGHLTQSVTDHALSDGSLQPIKTEETRIVQGGITFLVRQISSLALKTLERLKRETESKAAPRHPINPFLPCDLALVVAELTDTHQAVLNKFPVIDHHLLIITRDFEAQEQLLTGADFEALWLALEEMPGLGFYNGGREAGASQPHKHLQLIPLPLSQEGPALPIESHLESLPSHGHSTQLDAFPFQHAAARLDPNAGGHHAHDCFLSLLNDLGFSPRPDGRQPIPYNLLMQRNWMMVVPRSKEHSHDISINALGFVGSLFVKNHEELQCLKDTGPLEMLRQVSLPKP